MDFITLISRLATMIRTAFSPIDFRLILPLVAVCPFLLAFSWGKYEGRLYDKETNAPVEGALIVAQWEECFGFGHCNSFCVHSEVAETDSYGRFAFKAWSDDAPKRFFYKPGYEGFELPRLGLDGIELRFLKKSDITGRQYFISRFTGTLDQRLAYLGSISVDCSSRDSNGSMLPAVYEKILDEAKQYNGSTNYKRTLLHICRNLGYAFVRHGTVKVPHPTEEQMVDFLRKNKPDCRIAAFTYKDGQDFEQAVHSNDVKIMRKFLSDGLEVESLIGGQRPLVIAADRGNYEAMEELLKHGWNPNGHRSHPRSVIFDLIEASLPETKKIDIFSLLIKHGVKLDVKNEKNHTLFESAIFHGDVTISQLLMDRGADVGSPDTRNEDGRTLVESAYYRRSARIVEILMKRGVDVSRFSVSQTMAMMRYPASPGTSYSQISFCDLLPEGTKLKDGAKINGRCDDYTKIRSDLASQELKKLLRETKIRGSRHLFRVTVDCDSARLKAITEKLEAYDVDVVKYTYTFEANSKKKEKARIFSDELKSNVKQCIIDQYYKDITFPADDEEIIVIKIDFPVVLAKEMAPKIPPRSN